MTNHTDTSRSGDLVERHCNICKRPLDNPSDPMSLDCGGDCLRCMAVIAEDPDCAKSCIEQLEAEIARKDEALSFAYSWLDRWATHIGMCQGGQVCMCGLTRLRFDITAALDASDVLERMK